MKTNKLVWRLMNQFLSSVILMLVFQNLYGQAPTITGFTPASGPVGTSVTITGTNFNTTPDNNVVLFGATKATVTAATATQLTVSVPAGATYSPITVLNTTTDVLAYSPSKFTPTFTPGKGSITTSDFSAAVGFATGLWPISVPIGDLDGDGKPDVVVANYTDNTISVLRNTSTVGTINYAAKIDLATGNGPSSVAMGDLDGDGKLDLAVANLSVNTISVFRNTSAPGSISFIAAEDAVTGEAPQGVSIGDVDGDGKADLVVATFGTNKVSVFRNTSTSGAISFASKTDFSTGSNPYEVSIGDLDGDGKPDLSVANYWSGSVSVLRNTSTPGNISYAAKADFTAGLQPRSVSIGDLDGDGKADLAVMTQSSFYIHLLRNTSTPGTISFATKVDVSTGSNSAGIGIGDLDGDGKPDLATGNQNITTVSVFRNTSTVGAFSYAAKVELTSGASPSSISIGDLDGDGLPDLVATNSVDNSISVLRNKPVGAAPPTITSFTPTSGPAGTSVTITGTNFSATPANNTVSFNNTVATVTASTTTSITTTVPAGATTGKVAVTVGGVKATSSGNFTVTCTNPTKPTITHTSSGDFTSSTLTASAAPEGGTYQWYHNGSAIGGATSQSYVTADVGSYTVRITVAGGCHATSEPFNIVITDTEQPTLAKDIVLFPNPVLDWLTLSLGTSEGQKDITIYQATGKTFKTHDTVSREVSLNVADYPAGMYIVKVRTSRSVGVLRFIKQ